MSEPMPQDTAACEQVVNGTMNIPWSQVLFTFCKLTTVSQLLEYGNVDVAAVFLEKGKKRPKQPLPPPRQSLSGV